MAQSAILGVASLGTGQATSLSTSTFSEDGTGTTRFVPSGTTIDLGSDLLPDPGPGGLASALTFDLTSGSLLTAGDVLIYGANGLLANVARFNPNQTCANGSIGCLVFYSLQGSGLPADTGGPTSNYANTVTLTQTSGDSIVYGPRDGQPGSRTTPSGVFISYTFVINADDIATTIPEPGTVGLFAVALAGFAGVRRRVTRAG